MKKKRLIIGATGASGIPLLVSCLKQVRSCKEWETGLILSAAAKLTMRHETELTTQQIYQMADEVYEAEELGARPASGSYHTDGMLIVPCSMKTIAGICSGYAENLLLRAADVTIKEGRPLVLAARETPLSTIHLRNMQELSRLPEVHIIPPMMTWYHRPKSVEEMTQHLSAKLLEPFGIQVPDYRRWNGM